MRLLQPQQQEQGVPPSSTATQLLQPLHLLLLHQERQHEWW
jgi:hypothetical protein